MSIPLSVDSNDRKTSTVPTASAKLSRREEEVLTLLAQGCFYKDISSRLDISVNTLRTHIRRLYQKLDIQTRTEAMMKFRERTCPRVF